MGISEESEKMVVVDGPVIGIDLGCCYSRVAVWHNNRVVVIPNDLGKVHTPSWVAFLDHVYDDDILAGQAAKRYGENTIYGMKHLIGRRFEEFKEDEEAEVMQRYMKRYPFKVVKGQQGDIKMAVNHEGEEKTYAVQQILSLVLRQIKLYAEWNLKIMEVENAVITVPAMFNNLQRQATIDAAAIAGLNVVRILNETTAAALAYVHQQQHRSIEKERVLVVDCGGGKLDVSEVEIDGPHLFVKNAKGDTCLLGEQIDDCIVGYLADEFRKKTNIDITQGNPKSLRKLRREWVEYAKAQLSYSGRVQVEIECLYEGIDFEIDISREKFEELTMNIFNDFDELLNCLGPRNKYDEVVLVGGLSRIPKIQDLVKHRFLKDTQKLRHLVNPNSAVVIGAAIQGAILSGVLHVDIRNLRVQDITTYDVCTKDSYTEEEMSVVVHSSSSIPICVSRICHTKAKVFDGNKSLLGNIMVEGSSTELVELMFTIDEDGILTVTAKDTDSELIVTITNNPFMLSDEEIEKMTVEMETWRTGDNELELIYAKKGIEAGLLDMTNKLRDQNWKVKMEQAMYSELQDFASELKKWIEGEGNDASSTILRHKKIKLNEMQNKMSPFVSRDKLEDDASESVEIVYEPVLGVDIGTSNSCVAVWENGDAKIIISEQGNRFIPSYVAFSNEDDEILYGEVAKAQLTCNTHSTVYGFKRLIGRKFNDEMVQEEREMWPFEVTEGEDNEPMIIVEYKEERKHYSALEIMSILLKFMKGLAEKMLNKSQVKDVVITVPVHFGQSERTTIENVAKMVGLEISQIISEPTAAAMTYLSNNSSGEKKIKVLVFDLGGGTLDVSLLEMHKSIVEVKAVAGNSRLGGEDFDKSLIKHLIDIFNQKNHVDISKNKKSISKLKAACEMAKWRLCAKNCHSTKVEIEALYKGEDLCETVHRTKFEELNQDLFEKCIKPVQQCLEEAKLAAEEVGEVILVGGSTRIPKIRELLKEFFQGKELFDTLPPEEVVASGAAIIGAKYSQGKKGDFIIEFQLDDVTHVSLGFMMSDGKMNFVIPRNSVIPTTKTITLNQMQHLTTLDVYEGEKERATENNFLGRLVLSDITSSSTGECKLEVSFSVDKNKEVQVIANDVITGTTIIQTFSKYRTIDTRREDENIRFQEKKEKRKLEASNKLKEELDSQSTKLKEENVKAEIGEYIYGILFTANSKAIKWLNEKGWKADLKDIERMQKDQDWLFTALTKKPDLQTDEVLPSCGAMPGAIPKLKLLTSLGFKRNNGSTKVLIPRNTILPRKEVITLYQNEYPITLEVYEGEKEMASENNLLGILEPISHTPTATGGWLLEVTFHASKNKDVQVTAKDTRSDNIVAKAFSDNDHRLNPNAITKMIQENENMNFEQKKAQEKREAFSHMEEHLNLLTYALEDSKVEERLGGHIYGILHEANQNAIRRSKSAKLRELNDITKMKEDVELIINALTKRISI